ncbi:MAG: ABC-F family ATP-binding cassette domain-containing protein [Clostridia bacterium]|nr:ABC-F family ATP-binding cassette domain-containing protein [Clostridia bacterium]
MAMMTINGIKKMYAARLLFENVSFEVNKQDKIGFIGDNGTGKTTLFRIISGEEGADEGTVHIDRDTRIGVMSQMTENDDLSLYESVLSVFDSLIQMEDEMEKINIAIENGDSDIERLVKRQHSLRERYEKEGGLTFRSRAVSALMGVGFKTEEHNRKLAELSGGERNKVQLARLLLSGANLLLLDEPTNHLDLHSVQWLEDYLKNYNGAFIVISHDRYFLDKVTSSTIELKNQQITRGVGNYSRYMELKSSEQETLRRKYLNTQREIKRIYGIVEQQRRFGRERNFITAESKLKQIERLKATLVAPEKDSEGIRFNFTAKEGGGNDVLMVHGLKKSYDKTLFGDLSMHIRRGDRVFILGKNGCGKSTLLRILTKNETADNGSFELGAHIKVAYYDQIMSGLNPDNTVLSEVWDAYPSYNHTEIRNALAAFLFKGDDVNKSIASLSGGEKARVQLLKMMLSGANLLLLDEPTNHLDIASREALENALDEYGSTMLIVTHDRYLVNRLADRILYMTEAGLTEYYGGYDDFLEAYNEDIKINAAQEKESRKSSEEKKGVNLYKAQKEQRSALNKAKTALKRNEEQIAEKEEELEEINRHLSLPDIGADYTKAAELSSTAASIQEEIDILYEEWVELSEQLCELEQS